MPDDDLADFAHLQNEDEEVMIPEESQLNEDDDEDEGMGSSSESGSATEASGVASLLVDKTEASEDGGTVVESVEGTVLVLSAVAGLEIDVA